MIATSSTETTTPPRYTIWGLPPRDLHDRFWAARGVQVIRPRQTTPIDPRARLYLLAHPHLLAMFPLPQGLGPRGRTRDGEPILVRLHNLSEAGYRERIRTDDGDRFAGFERRYPVGDKRLGQLVLTDRPALARRWQRALDAATAWRRFRHQVSAPNRRPMVIGGHVYDDQQPSEVKAFLRELVEHWPRPDHTIQRVQSLTDGVWADQDLPTRNGTAFLGPVWIGAGRDLSQIDRIVGPTVLWDAPDAQPRSDWPGCRGAIAGRSRETRPIDQPLSRAERVGKRAFDVLFSLAVLAVTLPFYPLVMLAIWLEDGRPVLFSHARESIGGREFPCLKFRTMRKDAEAIKQRIQAANQSDGPHFFMEEDPRLTRIGRWLRRLNIDELPQFWNVLLGHMSVVGPRPSPHEENQFCPPWREARLSVRPGITGLWQIRRTREEARDFQEWIRYDIEYVENLSWKLDAWIIGQTIRQIITRRV
jgi:lipopolysaccharide/colanic/teichoic acid biosynthesis glycosyltransferase